MKKGMIWLLWKKSGRHLLFQPKSLADPSTDKNFMLGHIFMRITKWCASLYLMALTTNFIKCIGTTVFLLRTEFSIFHSRCSTKVNNPFPQEIIEFPSVLVNSATGKLEECFQTYVRPTYHQFLTDFCKELTGIQQIQVDRGVPLGEALLMHDKWLEDKGIKNTNFAIVTWSNWDCRTMLESECRFKRIRKPPYFNRWINLKVPFHEVYGDVRCNLKEAVQLAGLTWEGRAHCGLDDARNTARLLALMMHRGFKFSITNSLVWQPQPAPQSTTCQLSPDRSPEPIQQQHKPNEMLGSPVQVNPYAASTGKDRAMYCYCGVLSRWSIVRKPGPMQGRYFYGCGNWTATRRAICPYFAWAS
ncbi:unnamed protein product [Urochloa humidicola]